MSAFHLILLTPPSSSFTCLVSTHLFPEGVQYVDGYIYPDTSQDPAAQIDAMLSCLSGVNYGMIWYACCSSSLQMPPRPRLPPSHILYLPPFLCRRQKLPLPLPPSSFPPYLISSFPRRLDIEPDSEWNSDVGWNQNFIQALSNELDQRGVKHGIYSNAHGWY